MELIVLHEILASRVLKCLLLCNIYTKKSTFVTGNSKPGFRLRMLILYTLPTYFRLPANADLCVSSVWYAGRRDRGRLHVGSPASLPPHWGGWLLPDIFE